MWKKIKLIYFSWSSALIISISLAVVILYWSLSPRPMGYIHSLDLASSALIISLSLTIPFFITLNKDAAVNLNEMAKKAQEELLIKSDIGYLSDVGQVREIDEDSVFCAKAFASISGVSIRKVLLIVADGMGGHSKGEVASSIAVESVAKEIVPNLLNPTKDIKNALLGAVKNANASVLSYATSHPECEGMGTTMTVTLIDENTVYIAHVGDTRAYLISSEEIKQLTKDHSYVQELVDNGSITQEQAKHHPQKNVITRVVGVYPDVLPDSYEYQIPEKGQVLLCCDGLVNHVTDDEIKEIVLTSSDPQTACKNLVDLANKRGGRDNISVVLTPDLSTLF